MAELTYEHILELFAKTDKRIEKVNNELSKKIGELTGTLGRFAEEQVRADLINKFDQWGIPVHAITNHYTQKDNNNENVYEVDILIYNS